MKKTILLLTLVLFFAQASFSQVKITKATNYKTIAGLEGVFMNYSIEFRDKKNDAIEIDSVKTIDDTSTLSFHLNKHEPCCNEITFLISLSPPARCKTCIETTPVQQNLTKGVMVYYRKGEKKSAFKVTKFKQLPDVLQP